MNDVCVVGAFSVRFPSTTTTARGVAGRDSGELRPSSTHQPRGSGSERQLCECLGDGRRVAGLKPPASLRRVTLASDLARVRLAEMTDKPREQRRRRRELLLAVLPVAVSQRASSSAPQLRRERGVERAAVLGEGKEACQPLLARRVPGEQLVEDGGTRVLVES